MSLKGGSYKEHCPCPEEIRLRCFPLQRNVKNEEFVENHFGDLPLPPEDELFTSNITRHAWEQIINFRAHF